jgi:hypothetical protein
VFVVVGREIPGGRFVAIICFKLEQFLAYVFFDLTVKRTNFLKTFTFAAKKVYSGLIGEVVNKSDEI